MKHYTLTPLFDSDVLLEHQVIENSPLTFKDGTVVYTRHEGYIIRPLDTIEGKKALAIHYDKYWKLPENQAKYNAITAKLTAFFAQQGIL